MQQESIREWVVVRRTFMLQRRPAWAMLGQMKESEPQATKQQEPQGNKELPQELVTLMSAQPLHNLSIGVGH